MNIIYAINKREAQDLPNRVRKTLDPSVFAEDVANPGKIESHAKRAPGRARDVHGSEGFERTFSVSPAKSEPLSAFPSVADLAREADLDPFEVSRMMADLFGNIRAARFYSRVFLMDKPDDIKYRGGNAADRRRFIRKMKASMPKIRAKTSHKQIFSHKSTSGFPVYNLGGGK